MHRIHPWRWQAPEFKLVFNKWSICLFYYIHAFKLTILLSDVSIYIYWTYKLSRNLGVTAAGKGWWQLTMAHKGWRLLVWFVSGPRSLKVQSVLLPNHSASFPHPPPFHTYRSTLFMGPIFGGSLKIAVVTAWGYSSFHLHENGWNFNVYFLRQQQ